MIVHGSDKSHKQVACNVSTSPNEITTVHLLAVNPKPQIQSYLYQDGNVSRHSRLASYAVEKRLLA